MTRATRLPPDERRRALIDATCPLLLEHGSDISTRQIAEAAGVAEGTIFRVFTSKQELVDASVEHVLSPRSVVEALRDVDAPTLDEAATQIIALLLGHVQTTRTLMPLLTRHVREAGPPRGTDWHARRGHMHGQLTDAIEAALRPHAAEMSVPPRLAATSLLTLSLGSAFAAPEGSVPAPVTVARILLHGIAREDHPC